MLVGSAGQAANFERVRTGPGNDVLIGNAADNTLIGSSGNDRLEGRGGDDALSPGSGDNTTIGGSGDDAYTLSFPDDGLATTQEISERRGGGRDALMLTGSASWTVNLASSDTTLGTSSEGSVVTSSAGQARNIEEITTGPGDDAITGNGLDNLIDAGEGTNAVAGGRGNDTYRMMRAATATRDTINELPRQGHDLLDFGSSEGERFLVGGGTIVGPSALSVSVDLSSSTTTVGRHGLRTVLVPNAGQATNLESVRGTAGDDEITGNEEANHLDGAGGNDEIRGGPGHDLLIGGPGSDLLEGQLGDDVYAFGRETGRRAETDTIKESPQGGDDTLDYSDLAPGSRRGVTINLSTPRKRIGSTGSHRLKVDVARMNRYLEDVIGGPSNDSLVGNASDNTLVGGPGNDRLRGRGGQDTLLGNAGSDRLIGSRGHDTLNGGAGRDILLGGGGGDTMSGGSGSDRLLGQGGNDRLRGATGADTLDGGSGNDSLAGGDGRDNLLARDGSSDGLNGGPGSDRARFDGGLDRVRSVERPT